MAIGLKGIHHVQFTVCPEDETACRAFYGEVLGLRFHPDDWNVEIFYPERGEQILFVCKGIVLGVVTVRRKFKRAKA